MADYKGMLYGAMVGDALGVPVEFEDRGSFNIDSMIGYGTCNQPPGTWSDDSSLTLCLAKNINEQNNIDGLMRKFVCYLNEGYMTPFGIAFGVGNSTKQAIKRYEDGIPAEQCGGTSEYNNGNGALMRIAPLIKCFPPEMSLDHVIEKVIAYTRITHGHPRAIMASIIYIEILRQIAIGYSFKVSVENTEKELNKYLKSNPVLFNEFESYYERIFQPEFYQLPQSYINSSGYVVDTLEAALWCIGNTDNFKDAVLKAVNLGEDTDTVGSVAGAIAGLLYGFDTIPEKWVETLVGKADFEPIILTFIKD
ncbi:ADP-ribosylglycohydrolase family protein [Staphylococcus carnosus]|uniref:ADP-ribosylglycohydrolase n=1 Tax=Staphylococcus carnosus TaxID=1281 RepID=A0AAJ0JQ61_STACA|nr:ADP-ribosylglycohydrolase family protein [Staphylococcus carnosus]KKB25984.1 ADP-ribosylglycohydrolase [Staphylococcus carnosus]QQS84946.1 ADP-ribosylglycohydrolase family protein [Staphylococcus carnosus]UTC00231.1 ADP-ribosylglycohydrolase [Staphylococcus carnosus]UTC02979.1 ADP-ribosylglycohydrolase [Staphylococcus carnosus]